MSGHTPGPWTENHMGHLVGSDGNKVLVAGLGLGFASGFERPERYANARLIAAAPELAASLEWALDRIKSAGLGEGERFAQAEAVLVKAVHS